MFSFMVTSEGGLTTAGYAIAIIAGIVLFLAAIYFAGKNSEKKKLTTRQLVFCAVAMALAFVTSYLKIFTLPWGGSVTLCSMLFIVLVANWYGVGTGITVGLAYGILQFIQEPYVLSFFQVCCDYILAFAALGIAGFFAKQNHGLLKGYIAAVVARGFFHALGGYLYWMSYMPDNFPKSLTAIYPIVYNYSYLLAEGIITVIVISIPAVSKALTQVKKAALGTSLKPASFIWYFPVTRQFTLASVKKNRKGTCQSPCNPWAECKTETLSYVVPLEKFSWCFRSAIFRINNIAVYKNSGLLLCHMEKMSRYFFILLVTMSVISRHCSDIYSATLLIFCCYFPGLLLFSTDLVDLELRSHKPSHLPAPASMTFKQVAVV